MTLPHAWNQLSKLPEEVIETVLVARSLSTRAVRKSTRTLSSSTAAANAAASNGQAKRCCLRRDGVGHHAPLKPAQEHMLGLFGSGSGVGEAARLKPGRRGRLMWRTRLHRNRKGERGSFSEDDYIA
jgi:hypothetical protein